MTTEETPRDPTLAELFSIHGEALRHSIHVSMPGRVEKYDSATQKADVKPLVNSLIATREGDELLEEFSVIPSVPVLFLRGGGFFVSVPIAKGDLVTLLFSDRSIDKYLAGRGALTDPDDFRTHALTDAAAIPGGYPFALGVGDSGVGANLVLGKEGGAQIHVKQDEVHLYAENAADFVALAAKVKTQLDTVINDINTLKTQIGLWVILPGDGGSALKVQLTAWIAAALSPSTTTGADKVKAT